MIETVYKGQCGRYDTRIETTGDGGLILYQEPAHGHGEDQVILTDLAVDAILTHFNPDKEPACADH